MLGILWIFLTGPDPVLGQTSIEETVNIDTVATIEEADHLLRYLKRLRSHKPLQAKVLLKKAQICLANGRIVEARQEFRRCMIMTQQEFGETSPEMADVLEAYVDLLTMTGQTQEAEAALQKIDAIRNP